MERKGAKATPKPLLRILDRLRHSTKKPSKRAAKTKQGEESSRHDAIQLNTDPTTEGSQIGEAQRPQLPAQQLPTLKITQDDSSQPTQPPKSLESSSPSAEYYKTQHEDTTIEKPTPEAVILSPPIPVPSRETLDRQQTLDRYNEEIPVLNPYGVLCSGLLFLIQVMFSLTVLMEGCGRRIWKENTPKKTT
jgi:hypothetical protein